MTGIAPGSQLDNVIAAAMTFGSATRTDLLTAAVTAHAPSTMIDELLRLPERRFHSQSEVAAILAAPEA